MKLYATVTSERASKGQGGNEFLTVNIFDGQKVCHGSIDIRPDMSMDIRYMGEKHTIKGEKQKGECKRCAMFTNGVCDNCRKPKAQ